ncbi:heparan-alpha-glucosaminide N-acetyltransferase domain-containing protein [Georgenia yuyongxinii]|uniref:DUF1624 domain-containing protein n=1 Tax=Georgenia yuyongxinii TaxID=2589797 RepID=A0A552WP86_9MICO|nr:heparan-alpha-glucosaminide N-acetyltransferase domain-containing protein [Georgenia yuyongxinii]TRW44565.1 DUF1624 domain-containing protein [Georgenia yuyongxinii]
MTSTAKAAPARTAPARPRLVGVDATRGVALLGMMAVHSLWSVDAAGNETWTYALFAGRAAATFAVLAGVGVAFMTGRRQVGRSGFGGVAAMLATRALAIGLIGLALGFADSDVTNVILAAYAVLFVLAIPLVLLPTRALVVLGAAIMLLVPVLSHLVRPALPVPTEANPSFVMLFTNPAGLLSELTLTGVYPALPWLAYLCAGLAIGRLHLSAPRVARGLLLGGAVAALVGWGLSRMLLGPAGGADALYATAPASGLSPDDVTEILVWGGSGTTPTTTWWWLAVDAPHTATPLDLLHTGGCAVALLGALLLVAGVRSPGVRLAISPLAAAGSMTLTLYSAHVAFLSSPLDVLPAVPGYLAQVAVVLVVAVLWRRTRGRGPLEALVATAARRAREAVTRPTPRVLPH